MIKNIKFNFKASIKILPCIPMYFESQFSIKDVLFEKGWYAVKINIMADQFMSGTEICFDSKHKCMTACIIHNYFLGYTKENVTNMFSLYGVPILADFIFPKSQIIQSDIPYSSNLDH